MEGKKSVSVKDLEKKIKKLEKEKDEVMESLKRLKADNINEKKQSESYQQVLIESVIAKNIQEFLPIIDSIIIALELKDVNDVSYKKGVEAIYDRCISSFSKLGVTMLNPMNEKFDPHKHESVGEINVDKEDKDGLVLKVVRFGAILNDRVIRAPLVYVGVFKKNNL